MAKNEIIDTILSKNAAGLTHFVTEYGGGSMKKGLAKVFTEAAESVELKNAYASVLSKSNKKDIVIGVLATAVLGLATYIVADKNKKDASLPNDEKTLIKAASAELENMSEEEVEEAISVALAQEESENKDKEEGE